MFRNEDEFVEWLRRRKVPRGRGLALGIGDDAALVRVAPGHELILTSDWTIEDIHFRGKLHPAGSVGHRALARSLSDIAAMGGRPRFALVSLAISRRISVNWVKAFYAGMDRLARRFGVAIVGGDTSVVQDRISIDVVVVGEVFRGRALRRSGARPGDQIFVSGRLGLSALGLKLLASGRSAGPRLKGVALRAHLCPEPQCALGEFISRRRLATAMMDLSDGLSSDLARLCRASGVGARIWEALLPVPDPERLPATGSHGMLSMPWVRKIARHKIRAAATFDYLALALHGGEDYQLLFTVPARTAAEIPSHFRDVPLHRIGIIERGSDVRLVRTSGQVAPLKPAGFDHFRITR